MIWRVFSVGTVSHNDRYLLHIFGSVDVQSDQTSITAECYSHVLFKDIRERLLVDGGDVFLDLIRHDGRWVRRS